MRRRIFALPISAILIFGLCAYKLSRSYEAGNSPPELRTSKRLAASFELYDQHKPSELVRLVTFQGRQRILIVFFDGQAGADQDVTLLRLRRDFDKLKAKGILVLAISTALPQDNRRIIAETGEFPFPLLSDPGLEVHRGWGRLDKETGRTVPALFLVDRAGFVAWFDDAPQPLADAAETIDRLISGN